MPVEKKITKPIERIYKWNAENLGLFIWIKSQQSILPTIRIEQAITSYFRFMKISFDDWDMDSAKSTFTRLQKEFIEDQKNETSEKNR